MSINIVLQQMVIIFILILIGFLLSRRAMLGEDTSRQISSLIVNFCNPALLICSALDDGPKASGRELFMGAFIVILAYAVLLLFGQALPYLLRAPKKDFFAYRLLTLYGNVGFIGIPLASAVLGSASLIYVSINNLVYNVLIYTHGVSVIRKAAGVSEKAGEPSSHRFAGNILNAGTVSAAATLILYLCHFDVPVIFSGALDCIGRSTTFLSMLVLGVSVAQLPLRDIFTHGRLYVFVLLRMLLIPVCCLFLFRLFTDNGLIVPATVLMLAVPAGNMPLILAKQYGVDHPVISRGIILSTLLSLLTIPLVTLFV